MQKDREFRTQLNERRKSPDTVSESRRLKFQRLKEPYICKLEILPNIVITKDESHTTQKLDKLHTSNQWTPNTKAENFTR